MTTESAMYAKVLAFVVNHWKAAEAFAKHDSGPHARGKSIALNFHGIRVEPDVYGIVVSNSAELPIMGEGKLKMGGHEGTHAFAQALTYRNLGMLSFLFFPESEFSTAATATFRAMCSQTGIALLMVPDAKNEAIDPDRHVIVELAGGHPSGVVHAIDRTLTEIKGVGQKHLAHLYPSSLRDLLGLFEERPLSGGELERRFRREWRAFANVFKQRPYDPMVAQKVASGTAGVKHEYYQKVVAALLALGLVAPTTEGLRTTDFGDHLRRVVDPHERFQTTLSPHVRRLFAFAVMREFQDIVLLMLRTLDSAGEPVSTRSYCLKRTCGESSWRMDWKNDKGNVRCPVCRSRNVEPGLWLRLDAEAGESELVMSYPFLKFARATGLFESRRPDGWRERFPDTPVERPSGAPIAWNYLWRGEALGG